MILVILLVGAVLYVSLCYTVFLNNTSIENNSATGLNGRYVEQILRRQFLHDGKFFLAAAEKLQFHPHQPHQIHELYKWALLKSPADYTVPFSYGTYLSARKGFENQMLECFRAALSRFPMESSIHLRIGANLISMNQKKEGLVFLRRAIELNPNFASQAYSVIDQSGLAISSYSEITPSTEKGLFGLAKYWVEKRWTGRSEFRSLLHQLAARPLRPGERLSLARYALKAGELPLAAEQAQLLHRTDSSRAKALEIMADIARRNRNPGKAARESLLEEPDTRKAGYLKLAKAKSASGDFTQAAHILEEAIQKLGPSENLLLELARTFEFTGDYLKAAETYLKYTELTGEKIEGHNLAGDAFRRAGNIDAARREYETVLAKRPRNKHARQSLERLNSESNHK